MENITINLNVLAPYLSLKEYARVTGIPFETCRDMVKDGRIIIRVNTDRILTHPAKVKLTHPL
ncbi:hypothetical protein [Mixta mediterraneensis]|uniref:hypothetical protein n=1 Tax=Mixta mediterraneensis TaxID=2758443 RepID=UPI0018774B8C|nr:hypothetical protein [Mixta mediterraneensis]MBE5250705.1 hypothetical protein [Mixta mediterraneensis]